MHPYRAALGSFEKICDGILLILLLAMMNPGCSAFALLSFGKHQSPLRMTR